ncbi:GyrI-like domain-containing protein [Clostridiaceae bacterium M8S5]|nr:GyrI-like domain-containing protein [Clostridiaceae bacterium M8S5]
MEFMDRMMEVVDYIEDHITEDIDYNDMAKIVHCGVYQFGRIFSYVVGISFCEYIRRRRLALAALDMQSGNYKVIDLAMKYGYNSPDSFARAFHNMHGITPKEAKTSGVKLKMYPKLTFYITIKGDVGMEYRIENRSEINVVGKVKNIGKFIRKRDADNWKDTMGDVWVVWDEFLNHGMNNKIRDDYKLYREPFWQIGVTQTLENGETVIAIGAEANGDCYDDLDELTVPASTWAVFTAKGRLNQDKHPIGEVMTRIVSEWLPNSGYEKSMDYELEVYGPGNTNNDDYTCEVWIPIRKID